MIRTTDAALARRSLEAALAGQPELPTAGVDDLFAQAATVEDGVTVYTGAALDAAAASGWDRKANLTADQYDVGVGTGLTFDRSQWRDYCPKRADAYRFGRAHVLVTIVTQRRGGIGSVRLTSVLEPGGEW